MKSLLRAGHGAGSKHPHVEVVADELAAATPATTDRTERDTNGRFTRGNTVARMARVRPGRLGGIDDASPEFRSFQRWGRRYAAHRRNELALAHGGEISAGVGAMVESASLALAGSRYLAHLAAVDPLPATLKQSADLGALARQTELAAWELAAREAAARPKRASDDPLSAFAPPPKRKTRPNE